MKLKSQLDNNPSLNCEKKMSFSHGLVLKKNL